MNQFYPNNSPAPKLPGAAFEPAEGSVDRATRETLRLSMAQGHLPNEDRERLDAAVRATNRGETRPTAE
jgi:hypothetical protein